MADIDLRDAAGAVVPLTINADPAKAAKQDAGNALLGALVVRDDEGTAFNPDALPQTLAYTSGVLTSVSVTDGTDTWVQTFTYTSGNLTGVSAWVKQ
tara:strand:- start:22663 stop:22953 length:291 start_codon:yes stop_codon:yes gene_type:complete